MVAVSTAGAAASLRVHVWRKLRGLGALYVQQSVCLLPDLPAVARQVRRLAERVVAEGGQVRVLHAQLTDPGERDGLVAELRAERDAEYADLLGRLPGFFTELETERVKGRVSYVEVEENEADLRRFREWLRRVVARDYFVAPLREEAMAELARAERALEDFEADAYAVEEGAEPSAGGVGANDVRNSRRARPGPRSRLRAVREH